MGKVKFELPLLFEDVDQPAAQIHLHAFHPIDPACLLLELRVALCWQHPCFQQNLCQPPFHLNLQAIGGQGVPGEERRVSRKENTPPISRRVPGDADNIPVQLVDKHLGEAFLGHPGMQ